MELWWIILAGCGGGILLFAYVAFVIYKIAQRRKRSKERDPEGLTSDKDWAAHVTDLIERRQDGLCKDTISRSTKLRRTTTIPGHPEAVLQSVTTLETPVKRSQSHLTGRKERSEHRVGESSYTVEGPSSEGIRGHADDQRTEYRWQELLRQSSNAKITRSRSYHYSNPPEHRRASVRSLNLDKEFQGKHDDIKGKSLRGHKSHGSSSNQIASINKGAVLKDGKVKSLHQETKNGKTKMTRSGFAPSMVATSVALNQQTDPPRKTMESPQLRPEADYHTTSIDELAKSNHKVRNTTDNLENGMQEHQGPASVDVSTQAITSSSNRNVEPKNANKHISRSGSAPSTEAKESVFRRELELPPRQRSMSLRWIPEPDYQSVSLEELVLVAQSYDKTVQERNICIVEIHSPPNKVRKSVGSRNVENGVQESYATTDYYDERQGLSNDDQQLSAASDFVNKSFSLPGVAKRVTSDRIPENDRSLEKGNRTAIKIKDDIEETVSVKRYVENLQVQIPQGGLHTGNENSSPEEASNEDRMATSTTVVNDSNGTENSSNESPAAVVAEKEAKVDSSPGLRPSLIKEPEVRSIGKMRIIKNDDPPPWLTTQERTLKLPIRESPQVTLERSSSTKEMHLQDSPSTALSGPHSTTGTTRPSSGDLVKVALKTKNGLSSVDINNNVSNEDQQSKLLQSTDLRATTFAGVRVSNEVSINMSVKEEAEHSSVKGKENGILTLEEKKKHWKREQIVDQLHSARQRNSSQNYIFGTGLAYQSCMPELQNKLQELTLAK